MTVTQVAADQRTDEWRKARCGRVTGSRAGDVLDLLKSGKESARRRDYRIQLAAERLTGEPQDAVFVNADMQRGTELEPDARAAYEAITGALVTPVGFLAADDVLVGCSPDGLVGDDGLLELKCPRSATHLRYWRDGVMPEDYVPQVTHNLWVTGAAWCDFASYDPRLGRGLELFVVRVRRADLDLDAYAGKVLAFLSEVDEEVARIDALRRTV